MISIGLLLLVPRFSAHDFHASITQIDVNATTGKLEVAVKMFTDDLEAAVQPVGQPPLNIGTPKEHERSLAHIEAYLRKHLAMQADGRNLSLTFIGKETEADGTWCYFESENAGPFKTLWVSNTLLLSQFDDQVNIIHLGRAGHKQAKLTNKGGSQAVFE